MLWKSIHISFGIVEQMAKPPVALKNAVIVGTGMVSATHLAAMADLGDKVKLGGVLSGSTDSAQRFARNAEQRLGYAINVYGSIQDVAADGAVDFAIVLTPPNARHEIVSELARSGKSILMEKPVERNSEAAAQLVQICDANAVVLGIVFQHRMRASSKQMLDLIQKNTFGKLCIVEAKIPWWREQSYYDAPGRGTYARDGGGVLISQAIHTLDLMLSLTGNVSEVQAMASTTSAHSMESEDYVTAGLRFCNGAVGSLIASTASFPGLSESLSFQFDKAAVTLQSGQLTIQWRDGREEIFGEDAATGGGSDPMAFTHDWHAAVIDDFVNALNNGVSPAVTGREALQVHRLIDAIVNSSTQKRALSVHV